MKSPVAHILKPDGAAICIGRKARNQDLNAKPCPKCEKKFKKAAEKLARKARREAEHAARMAEYESGKLVQLHSGNYALRYSLNGKIVEEAIGTGDERKAKVLLPLCMHQIRRTGRMLNKAPRCRADYA